MDPAAYLCTPSESSGTVICRLLHLLYSVTYWGRPDVAMPSSADSGWVTWYRDELTRVAKRSMSVEPLMMVGQNTRCDSTAARDALHPAVRVVWGFQAEAKLRNKK